MGIDILQGIRDGDSAQMGDEKTVVRWISGALSFARHWAKLFLQQCPMVNALLLLDLSWKYTARSFVPTLRHPPLGLGVSICGVDVAINTHVQIADVSSFPSSTFRPF